MITGYEAFRLYLAFKLHFDSDDYDIFERRGAIRATEKSFEERRDKILFDKLAKSFEKKKYFSECLVANIAYNNSGVAYNIPKTMQNYQIWIKRRDSITKVFQDDIMLLENISAPSDIFVSNITIESKVILDDIFHYSDEIKPNPLISDKLRILRKLKRFVRYEESKIKRVIKDSVDFNFTNI